MSSLFRPKKSPRLNAPLLFVSAAAFLWALCAGTQAYPPPVHGAEDSVHVDQAYRDLAENAVYLYISGEPAPKTEVIHAGYSGSSPTSLPPGGTLRIEWADGEEPAEIEIQYQGQAAAPGEEENHSTEINAAAEVGSGRPSVFGFLFGDPPLPSARQIILAVILVPVITVLILCLVWRFRDTAAAKNGRQPGADVSGSLSRAVSLIVTDERGETQRVNTKISGSLSVGRDPANYLSFPDREMSPRHFSLTLENGGFYIQDLRSA
ncbi:MAG: FHA domain-containing protein, partial [Gracilibacteraceae bacterium]|nr:FHA domain-containing protein [Gracilibacteraceae bacterium]